jgi:copper chaperone NosL
MKRTHLKPITRAVLFLAAALLLLVLLFPIWEIQLSAPQYPEGLVLKIFAGKLGGDIDIVNGLNHYIGMKTLHANDFVEFTVLPYCVVFFALLTLGTGVINRRGLLYFTTILFVLFCIAAMGDFWRWEYNYGHDLNPEAPIQVPGMAYQPPLIGYKQLLNFGAFSIPDIGGWFFIGAVIILVFAMFGEIIAGKKEKLK